MALPAGQRSYFVTTDMFYIRKHGDVIVQNRIFIEEAGFARANGAFPKATKSHNIFKQSIPRSRFGYHTR